MSDQQRGWYISLLVEQWAAGGKLRNDPETLWVLAGAGSKAEFDKNSASVMAKFPLIQNQRFRANRRMLADATSCQALAEQNRAAGKLSAKLRKERKLDANARSTPVQRPFNEKSTELELELELETNKERTPPTPPQAGGRVRRLSEAKREAKSAAGPLSTQTIRLCAICGATWSWHQRAKRYPERAHAESPSFDFHEFKAEEEK